MNTTTNNLFARGYYDVHSLVKGEFTEAKNKEACVLTFLLSDGQTYKKVWLHFSGPQNTDISYKQLAELGWDGNTANPAFSNPTGVKQLECDHYNHPTNGWQESWKIVGGGKPLPADRGSRLAAGYRRFVGGAPAPATRPTAPPPANPPVASNATPPAATPATAAAKAPPADPEPAQQPTGSRTSFTKDDAWEEWQRVNGTNPELVKMWKDAVANVTKETGLHETKFTSEEWELVFDAASIPF